jgi:hypothetical protein
MPLDPDSLPIAPAAPAANTANTQTPDNTANNSQTAPVATQPNGAPPTPPQSVAPNAPAQVSANPPAVPKATPAPPAQNQNANDPLVQHASRVSQVARVLAGNPQRVSIDSNGNTVRTPAPLSRNDVLMAIALSALQGSLAGFSQRGPGATGRAAAAGFDAVSQSQQQANQQQQEQAIADYARRMQIADLNMRLYSNARAVGREDYATNQQYVSQFSDLANQLQQDHPEFVKGVATYADLPKFNVTKDSALPYKVVPRLDPQTGQQVVDAKGTPQWDIDYLVVDPGAKGNFLSDDDIRVLQEMGKPGFVDGDGKPSKLSAGNLPLKMALNLKSQVAAYQLSKDGAANFYKSLQQSGGPFAKTQAPDLAAQVKKDPGLVSALEKFNPLLTATNGNYEQAIGELGGKDPQAAGKILALYGGTAAVRRYDRINTPLTLKSEADAVGVLADPNSTPAQQTQAKTFLAQSTQQKAADARGEATARQSVEGTGSSGTGSTDVHQAADAIASGRSTFEQLTQGMGREASAFRRAVESDLLKRYPSLNLEVLKAYSKAADNVGQQGQLQMARSLFGAYGQRGSFDDVEDAIRAVPKAPIPMLSELRQKTAYQLGSPEMARLLTIKTDLATDLARFNTGAGSRGSDYQLKKYAEQLNSDQTPEQIEASLKEIRSISSSRLKGIVGDNPFLKNMTRNINDPVTKMPMGAPAGAKGMVRGSDGKTYWTSNGRDLLGEVQQ